MPVWPATQTRLPVSEKIVGLGSLIVGSAFGLFGGAREAVPEHVKLDESADRVGGDNVNLLDERRLGAGRGEAVVAERAHIADTVSREPDGR